MKQPRLTYLFLTFLLALLSASCKKDSLPAPVAEEEESGSGVYVSVVVNTEGGNTSRAIGSPKPGEEGDGDQVGTIEENRIYNLHVYFFEGEIDGNQRKGINSAGTTEIAAHHYFTQNEISFLGKQATTAPTEIEDLVIGKTYDVLVVANVGDKFDISEHETLSALTGDKIFAINPATEGEEHFCMSSAKPVYEEGNNSLTIDSDNSRYNPATVTVDVERMVARVDCHLDEDNTYDVGKDKVEIQGAILVNKYNLPSYVFKRVTNGTDLLTNSAVTYLGNENGNATTVASNYVVDPKTLNPPTENIAADYDAYFSATDWNQVTWKTLDKNITSTNDNIDYYFLDYTQENVVSAELAESYRAEYCTGIVFKAQYKPTNITTGDGTFYWYDNQAFASLDDVKKYSNAFDNVSLRDDNCTDYGITKYTDGICYYTYWIRHADDGDPDKVSPMEYAIVRNNIYQINVTSISTIGPVTPEDNVNAIIKAYVVNWDTSIKTEDVVWGDPVSAN